MLRPFAVAALAMSLAWPVGALAITRADDPATASAPAADPLTVVLAWADLIDEGRVEEAFARYIASDFVENSDRVRVATGADHPGAPETLRFFLERVKAPVDGRRLAEAALANGDLVTIDGRLGQDLFLVRDGKIVVHWETIHQGQGSPRNGGVGTRP